MKGSGSRSRFSSLLPVHPAYSGPDGSQAPKLDPALALHILVYLRQFTPIVSKVFHKSEHLVRVDFRDLYRNLSSMRRLPSRLIIFFLKNRAELRHRIVSFVRHTTIRAIFWCTET